VIRERTDDLTPVKVAVFGGKGGGTLAVQTIAALEQVNRSHRFVGYLNDRVEKGTALFGGTVACRFDDWRQLDDDVGFVAPLHKAGSMETNARRIVGLGVPDARWTTLVDPRAITAEGARIGLGSVVSANSQIGPDSSVGTHCFMRAGAIVSHDVTVSDFVYLGQNSVVLGYCAIETGAHIAPGSVVRDGTKVGRFALVTLGSVVTTDVPPYAIVRGNPAQIAGQISPLNHAID
jgi:carbonic anhydrase/acetyltransferase-like protein (isoleucine patch superfamily)